MHNTIVSVYRFEAIDLFVSYNAWVYAQVSLIGTPYICIGIPYTTSKKILNVILSPTKANNNIILCGLLIKSVHMGRIRDKFFNSYNLKINTRSGCGIIFNLFVCYIHGAVLFQLMAPLNNKISEITGLIKNSDRCGR